MRLAALVVLCLAAFPAAAQMYKCVDARGVTRYTDQPQPGCKGKEVEIRGQPLISDGPPPQSKDASELERDYQRRKINEGRAREAEEKAAARAGASSSRTPSASSVPRSCGTRWRRNAGKRKRQIDGVDHLKHEPWRVSQKCCYHLAQILGRRLRPTVVAKLACDA